MSEDRSNGLLETLTQLATEDCGDNEDRERLLQEIRSPDWLVVNDREDWGSLIPPELERLWRTLSLEMRTALYLVAKAGAGRGTECDALGEDC